MLQFCHGEYVMGKFNLLLYLGGKEVCPLFFFSIMWDVLFSPSINVRCPFFLLYCEFSLSDGELHRGWRNWRVRIIWERLRKWHLFLTFHGRAIPTKNNSRIDAIATYSSAITLVLFFGVSVLKIAKYGMNSEKCARFSWFCKKPG